MSAKKINIGNCRDAVKRLHEVMKLLEISRINLIYKEKRYSMAIAFLSLWVGFAIADFVAAATVVYTVGHATGLSSEYVFWNPEGGDFMNFTWFGIALIVSVALAFVGICYSIVCSFSRRSAREKFKEMHEELRNAKSAITEICPTELWYSGEA